MKRSRIFDSLTPLYIFSKLCGFADFHIDSGGRFVFSDKLLKCSSAYHSLMVLLLFYVLVKTRDQIVGSASTTLVMFNAAGLTLLFILNKVYQKIYARTRIAPLWKSLGVMANQMAALNMQLKHKQIGVLSALSFLPTQVFLTCLVAAQYYVSITMSSSATTPMVFAVILYLIETERTVITGQFCSLLIIIGNMFTTLAENITDYNIKDNVLTKFRFLAICHHDLCKSVRKTNSLYSVHLALSFGVDFVCFVTYTQLIAYDLLQGKVTKIGGLSMAWMVVLCSRILPIITASHLCMHSAADIKSSLLEIWLQSNIVRLQREIHMFNLQIAHEDMKITAAGLFPIKRSLLLAILGAVATYMIIVIQLNSHFTVLMLQFK